MYQPTNSYGAWPGWTSWIGITEKRTKSVQAVWNSPPTKRNQSRSVGSPVQTRQPVGTGSIEDVTDQQRRRRERERGRPHLRALAGELHLRAGRTDTPRRRLGEGGDAGLGLSLKPAASWRSSIRLRRRARSRMVSVSGTRASPRTQRPARPGPAH